MDPPPRLGLLVSAVYLRVFRWPWTLSAQGRTYQRRGLWDVTCPATVANTWALQRTSYVLSSVNASHHLSINVSLASCDYHRFQSNVYRLLSPTQEEVNAFARVCLSVCLSVCLLERLLKNACMDLDEMLRVDRCRDMDEFWARSRL